MRKIAPRVAVGDDRQLRIARAQRLQAAHFLGAAAVRRGERAEETRPVPRDARCTRSRQSRAPGRWPARTDRGWRSGAPGVAAGGDALDGRAGHRRAGPCAISRGTKCAVQALRSARVTARRATRGSRCDFELAAIGTSQREAHEHRQRAAAARRRRAGWRRRRPSDVARERVVSRDGAVEIEERQHRRPATLVCGTAGAVRPRCLRRRAGAARTAGCRRAGSTRAPSACRCAAAP